MKKQLTKNKQVKNNQKGLNNKFKDCSVKIM